MGIGQDLCSISGFLESIKRLTRILHAIAIPECFMCTVLLKLCNGYNSLLADSWRTKNVTRFLGGRKLHDIALLSRIKTSWAWNDLSYSSNSMLSLKRKSISIKWRKQWTIVGEPFWNMKSLGEMYKELEYCMYCNYRTTYGSCFPYVPFKGTGNQVVGTVFDTILLSTTENYRFSLLFSIKYLVGRWKDYWMQSVKLSIFVY